MVSVNHLKVLKGESEKRTVCKIKDTQLILSEPKEIEINIWRNDEVMEEKFEVQIHMPWGNIYTLSHHKSREEAEEEYGEIVEQLECSKAKIEMGRGGITFKWR